ncbi:MAG: hypothetical protein H0W85_02415 [Methylotenera sp.]|nr:hypothetical protein [Methylotenera sp.]
MKLLSPKEFNNLLLPENISVKAYEACIDIFITGNTILDVCIVHGIKEDEEIRNLSKAIQTILKQVLQQ